MSDTIFYVCKYTPLELLEGYGISAQRLDPAPASFECADSCAHPNLCGYGKAVLEEVLGQGIDSLLLVDCCDVCRRIYDVLQDRARMKFLFLFSLPHKNGDREITLMKKELHRLSASLEQCFGRSLNEERALAAWQRSAQAEDLTSPHILLTGAHGGSVLLNTIRERISLPVTDGTCTGNRRLAAPVSEDLCSGYAAALLQQEEPCMRMQFRQESPDPGAVGIICHTVKFCDYYGFAYRHSRKKSEVPLLKIETDCTPQSSGQLHTRLDAFHETIQAGADASARKNMDGKNVHEKEVSRMAASGKNAPEKKAVCYVAGVDSGSASTDAVILDQERRIVGSAVLPTGSQAASGAQKALAAALEQAGLQHSDLEAIVTTGYGRETTGITDGTGVSSRPGISGTSVTEITCHARGAHFLYPKARTVIDIGGQDSKVIRIDESGAVMNFVMNDKCAAGTGRFLDMMARTLELSPSDMSELGLNWKSEVSISSMCTVFAESEVVSLIAQNTPTEDIIHGLNMAIAGKTISLVHRLGGEPSYIMTGGVAQNKGVVKALEEKLGEAVYVCKEAQLCGALGAALIALERIM